MSKKTNKHKCECCRKISDKYFGNVFTLLFFISQGPYCKGKHCTYDWAQTINKGNNDFLALLGYIPTQHGSLWVFLLFHQCGTEAP